MTDAQILAKHYVIACVWADAPEGAHPRATREAIAHAEKRAWEFLEMIGPASLELAKRAYENRGYGSHPDCGNDRPWLAAMGHDLWLTSQGHGTGFWDRNELYKKHRDQLDACARKFAGVTAEFYRGWLYLRGGAQMTVSEN